MAGFLFPGDYVAGDMLIVGELDEEGNTLDIDSTLIGHVYTAVAEMEL